MCFAWSWDQILLDGHVTLQRVEAFQYLIKRFSSALVTVQWPDPTEFPYVERRWDFDGQLELQYMILCHNILDLAQSDRFHSQWYPTTQARVRLLDVSAAPLAALRPLWKRLGWSGVVQRCIDHTIGGYVAETSSSDFWCSVSVLRRVGHQSAERGLRLKAAKFNGGRFCSFPGSTRAPTLAGQLVEILELAGQLLSVSCFCRGRPLPRAARRPGGRGADRGPCLADTKWHAFW